MTQPSLLYRPADGWFGDVIPIYVEGTYHLFYAFLSRHDRGGPGVLKGVDWAHVSTEDFVGFRELPTAIPRGGPQDPDLLVGTGSVVAANAGRYMAFYTGINPGRRVNGEAEQVVLRATSHDLVTWHKDADFVLKADPRWYERHDWRDPFVFRDGDRWKMLLCARVLAGPFDRRGAVAVASSTNLHHWRVEPPLLSPGTTRAPECPEAFQMGPDWYLLYSTYSDRFATCYRVGPAPDGPWRRPVHDTLDSNDLYAIKTVSDGRRRYAIGWLATRAGDQDTGHRQWGGDLVAHELVRRSDGALGVQLVPGLLEHFEVQHVSPEVRGGSWQVGDGQARFDGAGFGWCSLGAAGGSALLDVTIDLRDSAEELGVALGAASDFGASYLLRLEPEYGRVVFDRRPHRVDVPFEADTDRGYVSAADHEIERPLRPEAGSVRIRVLVDGSAIVAYVNDVALSTRGYDLEGGELGLYAANGQASFTDVAVGRDLVTGRPDGRGRLADAD